MTITVEMKISAPAGEKLELITANELGDEVARVQLAAGDTYTAVLWADRVTCLRVAPIEVIQGEGTL